jgi:TldD protein
VSELCFYALDVAQKTGASACDVRFEEAFSGFLLFVNGSFEAPAFSSWSGVGVRAFVHGFPSFSSTSRLDKESVSAIAQRATKYAKVFSQKSKPKSVTLPQTNATFLVKEKKRVEEPDFDDLKETIKLAYQELKSSLKKATLLQCFISLSWSKSHRTLVNSEGAYVNYTIPRVGEVAVFTLKRDDGLSLQKFHQREQEGGFELFQAAKFVESIKQQAIELENVLFNGKQADEGVTNIVLSPELTGLVSHESVGHPLEADRVLGREGVQAGESYASAQSIGVQIGAHNLNISDDPTIERSNGYYLIDDEGVPAQKRRLIENGRINEFLLGLEPAAVLGLKSNGSSRCSSYDREPIPRMSNTFFEPGDRTFDELIEEAKEGVYFKSFREWNIDDRRTNQRYVALVAYKIKNGEVSEPLLMPVLEVTTFKLLSSFVGGSKDFELYSGTCGKGDPGQPLPVSMGGPHTLFKGIKVGRR